MRQTLGKGRGWTGRRIRLPKGLFAANTWMPPLVGRVPSDEEFSRQERLVVISERMCQRHFGGSPAAIGQTLAFSGRTWLIIGVMPKGFQFPDPSTDLWVPITTTDRWNDPREHETFWHDT